MTGDEILATGASIISAENSDRLKWEKCDIMSLDDVRHINDMTKGEQYLKVLFLAAYHNPDNVKKNPKIAWNVNITALAGFIGTMDGIKTFYYPSTQVVYRGGDAAFDEQSETNPVNRYGELKLAAERIVTVAGYNIVRLPVLIGPSLSPNKKHFYDVIAETLSRGESVDMFADQVCNFLDFDTAAKNIIRLVENPAAHAEKIVNVAGDEVLSKYELGVRIARSRGLDETHVRPISMYSSCGIFTEKRAAKTLMNNELFKHLTETTELRIKI
jgi:dTDP-4-dehydrorhamnose reductase